MLCHLTFTKFLKIYSTEKFSPLMGGFFLAPADVLYLRLHQKGHLGPKVILPDGLTDERTTGIWELDIVLLLKRGKGKWLIGEPF